MDLRQKWQIKEDKQKQKKEKKQQQKRDKEILENERYQGICRFLNEISHSATAAVRQMVLLGNAIQSLQNNLISNISLVRHTITKTGESGAVPSAEHLPVKEEVSEASLKEHIDWFKKHRVLDPLDKTKNKYFVSPDHSYTLDSSGPKVDMFGNPPFDVTCLTERELREMITKEVQNEIHKAE